MKIRHRLKQKQQEVQELPRIETVSIRGNGADKPFREVVQYWDKDGVLIAERDPCNFIRKEY